MGMVHIRWARTMTRSTMIQAYTCTAVRWMCLYDTFICSAARHRYGYTSIGSGITRRSNSGCGATEQQRRKCWKCSQDLPAPLSSGDIRGDLFCGRCKAVQPIAPDTNYFTLFGFDNGVNTRRRFDISLTDLDSAFKGLQKQLHPDKFASMSSEHQRYSAEASSFVNQAYQIMKTPITRANYLIQSILKITDTTADDERILSSESSLMVRHCGEIAVFDDPS